MSEERGPVDPATEEDLGLGEIEESEAGEGESEGDQATEPGDAEADEGDEGEAGDVDAPPPRQRSRGDRQIGRLRQERRDLRAETRRLQERIEALERPQPPRFDPERQARLDEQERQEVALRPPEEQSRYWYDKGRREFGAALMQSEQRQLDRQDRLAFQAMCRTDRVAASMADKVEAAIANERAAGNFRSTREDALNYLWGQEARSRAAKQAPKQRAAAARRVAGETTRPGGGRSDAARPASRESGYEAAMRRLRGQPL